VEQLAALARHCTLQEDNAAKVERQVRKSAAAMLLATRIGESFDALVTAYPTRGRGCACCIHRWRAGWCAGIRGLDVGIA